MSNDQDSIIDDAIDEAESHRATLSVTFLLACLYLGLTAIAANDQQLLLEENLTLQPFSVPVGLVSFFRVAPAFILILHAYILIHQRAFLVLLARSGSRRRELEDDEAFLRFPTPSVFRHSSGSSDLWLQFVKLGLFVVYVLLPLSVLCVIQYKYLPYHSPGMMGWHQFLIATDLVLMGYLLLAPQRQDGHGALRPLFRRGYRLFLGISLTTATVAFALFYSLVLAVVPGTWLEAVSGENALSGVLKKHLSLQDKFLMSETPPAELVAATMPSEATTGLEAAKELAYLRFGEGASLTGRDLRGADFRGAKLLKADLGSADLRGARLGEANLRGANLSPVDVDDVILELPRGIRKTEAVGAIVKQGRVHPGSLEKADLRGADLRDARLILANLMRADLRGADLTGVELTGADLRGALLQGAHLEGAELSYARLDGAYLSGARLDGATFDHASMVGATLINAVAVGATFLEADLEGARMAEACLLAADFRGASLVGSDLRRAHLQGTTFLRLEALDARGAHLGGACDIDISIRGLVDLRFIDFRPFEGWSDVRSSITQRTAPVLARIDKAMARNTSTEMQAACLGTPVQVNASLQWRELLYLDEQRVDAMQSWPPAAKQSRGRWDEAAFHRELASNLIQRACSKPDLANALALRGAGEAGPGDLALDIEVARQMISRFQPGMGCGAIEQLPRFLKRQIEWRLHTAAREAERK